MLLKNIHKSLLKSKKGASFSEYALLLALLGSTAATMVFFFGQEIIAFFEDGTAVLESHQEYAQTQGVPLFTLQQAFIPDGNAGALYTYDMNTNLTERHFHPTSGNTSWSIGTLGTGFPPGLSINPQTGMISGTPNTPGLFSFEAIALKEGSITIEEYLITINP